MKDGRAYLIYWIAGDDGAHVLEAVLSPRTVWTKQKGVFKMTGETLALIDSAADGKKTKPPFVGRLAAGTYAIERMTEFDGGVVAGKKGSR